MKKVLAAVLAALFLTGCGSNTVAYTSEPETAEETQVSILAPVEESNAPEYVSRFSTVTEIVLSDAGITVNGGDETETVYTSHDIIYYEDKDAYESGNPYGEGTDADKHTAEEAEAHTVVNITAPGAYRVSGTLSAGQLRIDLGKDAYEDPDAVVELILDNAEILCTVAPAILFLNTYECDGNWSADNASPDVDTASAGANLILEGSSTVTGSYVARIFKDKDGEKKLWKQDGAVYSYMSLNVFGPGSLELNADNEGLDTELHLTINGGNIDILSHNDGINTNEDSVSVTAINGGNLHIIAGIGTEGDGIDSNGYLVINGGTVISIANPASDAGLDSNLGSYIHGGTVIALGSTMDWAESDSNQVTMNLQFADFQSGAITVKREDGTEVFSFDPGEDEILLARKQACRYMGAILSCPGFAQGETYSVYLDGTQMMYTGTDVTMDPGGMGGGFGGQHPEGGKENWMPPEGMEGERPTMPENFNPKNFTLPEGETFPQGEIPEGGFGGGRGMGDLSPESGTGNMTPPEDFGGEIPTMPESETFPGGEQPEHPRGGFGGRGQSGTGEASTEFYMADKVNAFSGVTAVNE